MQLRKHLESSQKSLRIVERTIDQVTTEHKVSQENYGKILVTALEAVNNAIIHGNRSDSSKFVDFDVEYSNGTLTLTVTDEGTGFIPDSVPDPTMPNNIEKTNGRGVFLMSRLADAIEYNEEGNSVKLIFKNI